MGCYKAILTCADSNLGFYERLGFRRHENSLRYDIDGISHRQPDGKDG